MQMSFADNWYVSMRWSHIIFGPKDKLHFYYIDNESLAYDNSHKHITVQTQLGIDKMICGNCSDLV